MDCFISTYVTNEARLLMAKQTVTCMASKPFLQVTVIDAGSNDEFIDWVEQITNVTLDTISNYQSQFYRYLVAEELSRSDYYILTDDDILPIGESWFQDANKIIMNHAQFGYFTLNVSYDGVERDCTGDRSFDDGEVVGATGIGGLRFIKKLDHYSEVDMASFDKHDDVWYCERMRKSGYSTGVMKNVKAFHLGASNSVIWGGK